MTIAEAYNDLLTAPTDMKAHIPILRACAAGKRVIEFGCRRGVSTMAMMAGRPTWLQTYDLDRTPDVDLMLAMAKEEGVDLRFVQADIDKLESVPECDFAFVDAMHNGNSVAIQLRLLNQAGAIKIALHDTEIFGRSGDLPNTPGILDAVDAFLSENKEWRTIYQTPESYGLTVIQRARYFPGKHLT